jgi:phosphoribosyl-AMP cyclohydrolase
MTKVGTLENAMTDLVIPSGPLIPTAPFTPRGTVHDVEHGEVFQPTFNTSGLIPAIVTEATTGAVLMFAWMNADALRLTIETKIAHFYSRSRGKLWKKGEESGNLLQVSELTTDCDQDVVALKVTVSGAGVTCHTGAQSCFYRAIPLGGPIGTTIRLTPTTPPGANDQPVVK